MSSRKSKKNKSKSNKNNTQSIVLVPLASRFHDISGILPPQPPAPQHTPGIPNNAWTKPLSAFGSNVSKRSGIREAQSTQDTIPPQRSSPGSPVEVGLRGNAYNPGDDENGSRNVTVGGVGEGRAGDEVTRGGDGWYGIADVRSGNVRLEENGAGTRSDNRQLGAAGIQYRSNDQVPSESIQYGIDISAKSWARRRMQSTSVEIDSRIAKLCGGGESLSGNESLSGDDDSSSCAVVNMTSRSHDGRLSVGDSTIPSSVLLGNVEPQARRISTREHVQSIRYGQLSGDSTSSLGTTTRSQSALSSGSTVRTGGAVDNTSGHDWYGLGNDTVYQQPQLESSSVLTTAGGNDYTSVHRHNTAQAQNLPPRFRSPLSSGTVNAGVFDAGCSTSNLRRSNDGWYGDFETSGSVKGLESTRMSSDGWYNIDGIEDGSSVNAREGSGLDNLQLSNESEYIPYTPVTFQSNEPRYKRVTVPTIGYDSQESTSTFDQGNNSAGLASDSSHPTTQYYERYDVAGVNRVAQRAISSVNSGTGSSYATGSSSMTAAQYQPSPQVPTQQSSAAQRPPRFDLGSASSLGAGLSQQNGENDPFQIRYSNSYNLGSSSSVDLGTCSTSQATSAQYQASSQVPNQQSSAVQRPPRFNLGSDSSWGSSSQPVNAFEEYDPFQVPYPTNNNLGSSSLVDLGHSTQWAPSLPAQPFTTQRSVRNSQLSPASSFGATWSQRTSHTPIQVHQSDWNYTTSLNDSAHSQSRASITPRPVPPIIFTPSITITPPNAQRFVQNTRFVAQPTRPARASMHGRSRSWDTSHQSPTLTIQDKFPARNAGYEGTSSSRSATPTQQSVSSGFVSASSSGFSTSTSAYTPSYAYSSAVFSRTYVPDHYTPNVSNPSTSTSIQASTRSDRAQDGYFPTYRSSYYDEPNHHEVPVPRIPPGLENTILYFTHSSLSTSVRQNGLARRGIDISSSPGQTTSPEEDASEVIRSVVKAAVGESVSVDYFNSVMGTQFRSGRLRYSRSGGSTRPASSLR